VACALWWSLFAAPLVQGAQYPIFGGSGHFEQNLLQPFESIPTIFLNAFVVSFYFGQLLKLQVRITWALLFLDT
jgi:hypothetical protein